MDELTKQNKILLRLEEKISNNKDDFNNNNINNDIIDIESKYEDN